MASIFGSELRARFGGYKPSLLDHSRAHRLRDGLCLCGLPVAEHFNDDNQKLSCEAAAEARQHVTCDVCRQPIAATQTTKTLADGTLICSERCELDFYEARR
jgi:hypothetical protein